MHAHLLICIDQPTSKQLSMDLTQQVLHAAALENGHMCVCGMQCERTCMGMRPSQENSWLLHQPGATSHSSTKHSVKKLITAIRSHNCHTQAHS